MPGPRPFTKPIPDRIVRLSFDAGTLLVRADPTQSIRSPGDGWEWDHRVSAWRCLAANYAGRLEELRATFGKALRDEVPPPARVAWPLASLPALRPDQREALAAWQSAGGRGVIVMPTGTGKTEVALAAMQESRVATLIVAPVRDLMYQWHQRVLRGLGYDAGIVGDSLFNLQPITVTTYDSAYAHMPRIGHRFGLIIFDEAHHLPGKSYREAAMYCAAPLRMGLTATPERSDGADADYPSLVGPIVYRQEISSARGKTLAEYEVVRIAIKLRDEEQADLRLGG